MSKVRSEAHVVLDCDEDELKKKLHNTLPHLTTHTHIYAQLGVLMAALINSPHNVAHIHALSKHLYRAMGIAVSHALEVGAALPWVADRLAYVRHIMCASAQRLQQRISQDHFIQHSRSYMDMCSRAGVMPPKPPGC